VDQATPKGASWIKQLERFFADLTNKRFAAALIETRSNSSVPFTTTST